MATYITHEYYTGTSANSTAIWGVWNGNITATSASTLIWSNWVTTAGTATTISNGSLYRINNEPSEQEIEARRRREEQRQREAAEAQERATALLKESLSEDQLDEFERERAFTVISADGERVYKIRPGWARNVDLIREGRCVRTYCAHPREGVPVEDNMLAQKLFLESDEETFLRIAYAS